MKIKTFPLQFTEEYLNVIRAKAEEQKKSIKDFILEAIADKLKDGE